MWSQTPKQSPNNTPNVTPCENVDKYHTDNNTSVRALDIFRRASSGPGQLQMLSCTFSLDQQSPRAGRSVQKYLTIPFTYFSSLWFGQNKPSQFLLLALPLLLLSWGCPRDGAEPLPALPVPCDSEPRLRGEGCCRGSGQDSCSCPAGVGACSCIMRGTSRRANLMTCRGKLEGKICGCSLSGRDSKRSPQGASGWTRNVY